MGTHSYAAHVVVKKDKEGRFKAGFSSKINGSLVESFGKWYGSQMRYNPFKRAYAEAEQKAAELNQS